MEIKKGSINKKESRPALTLYESCMFCQTPPLQNMPSKPYPILAPTNQYSLLQSPVVPYNV